jgi:hypothetical protein
MASVESSNILYLISDEMLFPDEELEDGLASGPQMLNTTESSAFLEEGRPRRVFWPYARIACRSSVRGNC